MFINGSGTSVILSVSASIRYSQKITLLKILILHGIFFVNVLKKFARKEFFFFYFFKNLNWEVIVSWVIIFYKIIKFVSISYKICCKKCFMQNILQTN